MQRLVEGIHQFQNDIFSSKRQLFERLAKGQQPLALFVTCSDSRIDPALLTQTEPGGTVYLAQCRQHHSTLRNNQWR